MKIEIQYVCPECGANQSVTIDSVDKRTDFECQECGFENSITREEE